MVKRVRSNIKMMAKIKASTKEATQEMVRTKQNTDATDVFDESNDSDSSNPDDDPNDQDNTLVDPSPTLTQNNSINTIIDVDADVPETTPSRDETNVPETTPSRDETKLKATCWKFFDKPAIGSPLYKEAMNPGSQVKLKCKHLNCGTTLRWNPRTHTNFTNHAKSYHKKAYDSFQDASKESDIKKLNTILKDKEKKQWKDFNGDSVSFNQDAAEEMLIKWIVVYFN
jgi:hypothetical protein